MCVCGCVGCEQQPFTPTQVGTQTQTQTLTGTPLLPTPPDTHTHTHITCNPGWVCRSVLSVCVKRGRNLPGTPRSAPFVTLEYHGQQVRCRSGESCNPVWDQSFELDVTRENMPAYLWVYDAAVSADNTIIGG